MGTFAELFRGGSIPKNKKKEFIERVELLFQAGGMMEIQYIQLCGKKVATLRKAAMHDDGMDFFYNYFEEDCWENARFRKRSLHIRSGKIGWRYFYRAVVAAYVLEELYIDGPAVTMVDGELVTAHIYTGWVNYLFQENFMFKNRDPWQLFEAMHEQMDPDMDLEPLELYEWCDFDYDYYGMIGCFEIDAVLKGTDEVIKKIKTSLKGQKRDIDKEFFFRLC